MSMISIKTHVNQYVLRMVNNMDYPVVTYHPYCQPIMHIIDTNNGRPPRALGPSMDPRASNVLLRGDFASHWLPVQWYT